MNFKIALIGNKNVGKSTIFNNLTKTKQSLVLKKYKNLSRDRQTGLFILKKKIIKLIDTASFFPSKKDILKKEIFIQNNLAISESDIIFFIVNAESGLTYSDLEISKKLRKYEKPVFLIINKIDQLKNLDYINDFYKLGFQEIFKISALSKKSLKKFKKNILFVFKNNQSLKNKLKLFQKIFLLKNINFTIKVSVIGKPNAGKSTLINRLIKKNDRIITSKISGTTRNTVLVSTIFKNIKYIFLDTAGIRRKSKINSDLENIFVKKSISAVKNSDLSILVIDVKEKIISNQDINLSNLIYKSRSSMIILLNKWDLLNKQDRIFFKKKFLFRFRFIKNIKFYYISAIFTKNIRNLILKSIKKIYFLQNKKHSSTFLTKILYKAVKNQKPLSRNSYIRTKLKYAHSGGINPPIIIIHGNRVNNLSTSYKKYLNNFFKSSLNLFGIPLTLEFKNSRNPYV
ncbi:ribosome biogenesis GTPase Der [Buchnera aphidicola]|uniref:ribosome biogenesis GTPase Der n=1 Tax=Buchnera aphidicola TaxID=9 RepID=UPI0022387E7F|nr:ribosome biogenesis GTPase Der [Buchnera aphidicola]MCW5197424.1 ribosome biogenesis GTPase Der [Buchnera aphidicola (Chaitophorus viminalis)]